MIRLGVVGCGHWGPNLIRCLRETGECNLFIYDLDREKAERIKEEYPEVVVTTSYESLLDSVEAVVISTPPATHHALAMDALMNERDVFVEKPLSLNVEEGRELVNLAKEKRRILMVGHILRYHPGILRLKEMIDSGELGRVEYIYSTRLNLGRFRTEENILWSFAPHDISVIIYLLGEMPKEISAHGGNYLHPRIADVTMTSMVFASGVRSHIFVSWLHPYKEQRLVVVGDKGMAVFDDVAKEDKLLLYPHRIDWVGRAPVAHKEMARVIELPKEEPLMNECRHFISCIKERTPPFTSGEEALKVLGILEIAQRSLEGAGNFIQFEEKKEFFVSPYSIVNEGCKIGDGTKIWHFSQVMEDAEIGRNCIIGQNVFIGKGVKIGNGVKIQNNVSIYEKVTLEDGVFCGPSMVFTNVLNPRSHISRKHEFRPTLVKKGATIGANATIICGHTIGQYAFIGAGAVVTKDIGDYALVVGNPARLIGYMCECGVKLHFENEEAVCEACGKAYIKENGVVHKGLACGK
jgi:UDP-2-acetamido-3-amino-2,3-dideoxy-glucuronate N-acetyltransferase